MPVYLNDIPGVKLTHLFYTFLPLPLPLPLQPLLRPMLPPTRMKIIWSRNNAAHENSGWRFEAICNRALQRKEDRGGAAERRLIS
jgi:hypothetical protein